MGCLETKGKFQVPSSKGEGNTGVRLFLVEHFKRPGTGTLTSLAGGDARDAVDSLPTLQISLHR